MAHRKTAKTPAEVKEWIKQPHHWGQVLDAKKNADPKPGEATYLQLGGGNARDGHWEILIPKEVHEKCFLKPCLNGTHMYEWDIFEELKATAFKQLTVTSMFYSEEFSVFKPLGIKDTAPEMEEAAKALPNLEFDDGDGPAIFLKFENLEEDIVYIEKAKEAVNGFIYRATINTLNFGKHALFFQLSDAITFLLSLTEYKDELNLIASTRPTPEETANMIAQIKSKEA